MGKLLIKSLLLLFQHVHLGDDTVGDIGPSSLVYICFINGSSEGENAEVMLTFVGSFCLFLTKLICLFVDSAHRKF